MVVVVGGTIFTDKTGGSRKWGFYVVPSTLYVRNAPRKNLISFYFLL
jgi:hypothetical protein